MRTTKWSEDHQESEQRNIPSFNGKFIPERTECPFVSECETKAAGKCWHGGVTHPVPYQCATAKLIHLQSKYKRTG